MREDLSCVLETVLLVGGIVAVVGVCGFIYNIVEHRQETEMLQLRAEIEQLQCKVADQ